MKLDDNTLFELQGELQDLMGGYAGGQAARVASLEGPSWPLAAWLELLRRHPLVAAMGDELLRAVAQRQVDPNAVAREVKLRLRELEEDERAEASATAQDRDLPPQARDQMLATIALIARDELGIATLDERGRDSLDFHDCGVASLRAALIEAYVEGWHASA
jgi:hypothetical protein